VPISDTGIATIGMIEARPRSAEKRMTTEDDEDDGLEDRPSALRRPIRPMNSVGL